MKINNLKLVDLFKRTSSFSELVIQHLLEDGKDFEKDELIEFFRFLTYIISNPKVPHEDGIVDYSDKCASYMNEMIIEVDFITDENIDEISSIICKSILDSKYKKHLMESFKFLCGKFPEKMKCEYNKQKTFKLYRV